MPDTNNTDPKNTRDEYMENVTVGTRKLHNATIPLVAYDPRWPALFEQEASRIKQTLGNKVRQLQHVGSTSVPGLCAKPIIDILLTVPDSADEPAYVPRYVCSQLYLAYPRTRLIPAPHV